MQDVNIAEVERATHELEVLQAAYASDLKGRYAHYCDARIATYVPILLDRVLRLEEIKGQSFGGDDDGDDRSYLEGQKAIELLALVPEVPKPAKGEDIPEQGGFPLTRSSLWVPIARASLRGCGNDNIFARTLLKRVRLSRSEQKALRECLREFLSKALMFEPRLLSNLAYVTSKSEPIVVRALLHAAASRVDDERLLATFRR